MKKFLFCLLMLACLAAQAQTPTFPVGNLTATGTISASGAIASSGVVTGTAGLQTSGVLNLGGSNSGTLGQIAASNGTSPAGWKSVSAVFDNAYCSTIGQLLVRTIGAWTCSAGSPANPVWWGADPTGATDSTSAINSALTATRVIAFPAGTFKISSLSLQTSGTQFLGAGQGITILSPSTTTGDFVVVGTTLTNVSNITVGNFSIIQGTARTSGAEIHVINGHGVTLSNFVIAGTNQNGVTLDGGAQQFEYYIRNFEINNSTNTAIAFGTTSGNLQDVFVSTGVIGAAGTGMTFVNCSGVYVEDVDILGSVSAGVAAFPGTGQVSSYLRFKNVLADTSTGIGWDWITNGGSVYNVQMIDCWGSSSGGSGVVVNSANVNGITIIGGDYINNQTAGITLIAGSSVIIQGATIAYNSQTASNGYPGIVVSAGFTNLSIIGNQIGGYGNPIGGANKQNYGVIVNSGAVNSYIISLNRLDGNVTGTVLDNGTGSNKFVGNNI